METLADKRVEDFLKECPEASEQEIREFKELVEKYFTGQITPEEFKARRLQMGTYGIRNTHDVHMIRVKIPQGRLTADQLEVFADIAEEFSQERGHVTTRQAIQLYWIPTPATPYVQARLAAVGLTTREACGNSVRAVTCSPYAGVDPEELFDVTPHAYAVMRHFLRNPVSQKLPRKFKIAFEGSSRDYARTAIHDIGAVAAYEEMSGKRVLGFRVYAAGGLGALPVQAVLLEPFTPADELLRTCEAVVRVHDRLGDRKNRATARVKFVMKRLGVEAFRQEVFQERAKLPKYPYPEMHQTETDEQPPVVGAIPAAPAVDEAQYQRWLKTNVRPQKQAGYSTVVIRLVLGDIFSPQMRALADILRRFNGGVCRTMITQNLLLRWIKNEHLKALFAELDAIGLGEANAETLWDVTACPGASTCQLGIAGSRSLAKVLEENLQSAGLIGEDIEGIRIKISGCPNSCGQHHIADIGFYGSARKVDEHLAPHFQLMLGGFTAEGIAEFGKSISKIPARRVPEVVVHILQLYREKRSSPQESFKDFANRLGIPFWKEALEPFTTLPSYAEHPEQYRDWAAEAEFTLQGMGPGECAA
jgi:sulfite reductase beta subunit-like hemoprotein